MQESGRYWHTPPDVDVRYAEPRRPNASLERPELLAASLLTTEPVPMLPEPKAAPGITRRFWESNVEFGPLLLDSRGTDRAPSPPGAKGQPRRDPQRVAAAAQAVEQAAELLRRSSNGEWKEPRFMARRIADIIPHPLLSHGHAHAWDGVDDLTQQAAAAADIPIGLLPPPQPWVDVTCGPHLDATPQRPLTAAFATPSRASDLRPSPGARFSVWSDERDDPDGALDGAPDGGPDGP